MKTRPILACVAFFLAILAIASDKLTALSTDPRRLDLSFYHPGLVREPLPAPVGATPRSVILFIGDGMVGQTPAARYQSILEAGKDHTGLPVALYAFGPGALEFTGVTDNTQVPQRIARLLGIRGFPRQIGK